MTQGLHNGWYLIPLTLSFCPTNTYVSLASGKHVRLGLPFDSCLLIYRPGFYFQYDLLFVLADILFWIVLVLLATHVYLKLRTTK